MIPLVDVRIADPDLEKRIQLKIETLIGRREFIGGEDVRLFSEEFADFCGGGYCAPVGNGTDALALALRAFGIGPNDEVITVPFTFIATAEAIAHVGAKIKFVDIDPKTYTLDPALLAKAVTKKTKAIIPVHLFGRPCDMDPILEIAKAHDVRVIEDAAQAHGARYKGRRVGTLGDAGCFSFYPTKNLGGFGDGGAVVSRSREFIRRVDQLANHGRSLHYFHECVGYNSRLDAIQAAVLRLKLGVLDRNNEKRRRLAAIYTDGLADVANIKTPIESSDAEPVYHLYCIGCERRDELQKALTSKNIGCGVYYPLPLHLQRAFESLSLKEGSFPNSEEASRKLLALPMYHHLDPQTAKDVVLHIKESLALLT